MRKGQICSQFVEYALSM